MSKSKSIQVGPHSRFFIGGNAYLPIDPRFYGAVGAGANESVALSFAIAAGGLYLQSGLVFGFTAAGIATALGAIANDFLCSGGGSLRLLSGSTAALTLTGSTRRTFRDIVVDGNSVCGANPVIFFHTGADLNLVNVVILGGTSGQPGISLNSVVRVVLDTVNAASSSPNGLVVGLGGANYSAINCRGIADNVGGF